MEAKQVHDFISIYDLEAEEFAPTVKKKRIPLWKLLLKSTGIFLTITFIVFFIANYQYIRSQYMDWRRGGSARQVDDADEDGMPGWWEEKYGLSDSYSDDAFGDLDGDSANNYTEFQYGIDPMNKDTDGDGYSDGKEIEDGYNPNGEGRTDSDKDGIPDFWEKLHGMDKDDPADSREDPDNDFLINKKEYKYNTNPHNFDTDKDGTGDGDEVQSKRNPRGEGFLRVEKDNDKDKDGDGLMVAYENLLNTDPENSDSDGDGFDDLRELTRGYDPTGAGMIDAMIEIPVIGIQAPLIWSQSEVEEDILEDMNKGVIHYPGTAFPSMRGNSYITGHSSHYSWNDSEYTSIFAELDKVKPGDEIIVHMAMENGKKIAIVYEALYSEVVLPDDDRLFREYEGKEMTLVTCWPLGTDWKRLMIKADLKYPDF